ncbi:MAG: SH3 domain-containing protein [Thermomicrobiales bacterium]
MSRRSRQVMIRCGILALLLLTTFVTPIAALAAENATISEELNLRSGPGLGYRILTIMPAGSTVAVTGEPTEGWYPVQYNDLTGWAFGQYISIGGGSAPVASTGTRGTATVVTSQLNLRTGPGFDYSVVARLNYGTTVELLGGKQTADGYTWAEVLTKGQQRGWVANIYLDPGESGGSSEPADAPAAEAAPAPTSSGNPIIDIITEAALKYGQNPQAMLAVARCESGLNPNAYNARYGASGLFQFLPGTWRTTPFASYSIFDAWANANAAAWMWSVGRRGEWSC